MRSQVAGHYRSFKVLCISAVMAVISALVPVYTFPSYTATPSTLTHPPQIAMLAICEISDHRPFPCPTDVYRACAAPLAGYPWPPMPSLHVRLAGSSPSVRRSEDTRPAVSGLREVVVTGAGASATIAQRSSSMMAQHPAAPVRDDAGTRYRQRAQARLVRVGRSVLVECFLYIARRMECGNGGGRLGLRMGSSVDYASVRWC